MNVMGRMMWVGVLLALLTACAAPASSPVSQPAATEGGIEIEEDTSQQSTSAPPEPVEPSEESPPLAPITRGTLRFPHEVYWAGDENLDPASAFLFLDALPLLYNTLIGFNVNWQPAPSLAIKWERNDDATTWTFTLRDDVVFHDGSPLTSADVAYTFERVLSPTSEASLAAVLQIIEEVDTPDDTTVVFTLAQPHADFPILLTDISISIIPHDSGDTIAETGIGTGPFKLETLDPTGTTRLVANDEYWEGQPGLAAIELIGMPDMDARILALQDGQVDLVFEISPQDATLFGGDEDFVVQNMPSGMWNGLSMLTDTPPFDDVRVRKAMRLVANRQQMVDLTHNGEGIVSCDTPVWPDDPYRWEGACLQDIEQAKALLTEAGYPDGLDVTLYTSNVLPYFIPTAEVYQQQASQAGINVSIEQVSEDTYWIDDYMVKPFFSESGLHYPADSALYTHYHSDSPWNSSRMHNTNLEQILNDARSASDQAERVRLYQEAQKLLFEESGILIAYHINELRVFSSDVSGLEPVTRYAIQSWYRVRKEPNTE